MDLLHRVGLLVRVLEHEVDIAVGALAEPVLEREVLNRQGTLLFGGALHADNNRGSFYNIFLC